jgi:hypothetical protein
VSARLDTWQTNMLLTGKRLGAEIAPATEGYRAFLYAWGYSVDPARQGRPSNFLNANHSDVRFAFRAVELPGEHLTSDSADYFEHELVNERELASIEALEDALAPYLDNLSWLISSFRLDY